MDQGFACQTPGFSKGQHPVNEWATVLEHRSGLGALTDRQREIVHLLAGGLTLQQVADELVVGRQVVVSHVTSIRLLLDLPRRTAWKPR